MSKQERKERRDSQIEEMTEMWTAGDEFARGWYESKVDTILQMAKATGAIPGDSMPRPA